MRLFLNIHDKELLEHALGSYTEHIEKLDLPQMVKDDLKERVSSIQRRMSVDVPVVKPSVKSMTEMGLPKPMAQAVYVHWMDENSRCHGYDCGKLTQMLATAIKDMERHESLLKPS